MQQLSGSHAAKGYLAVGMRDRYCAGVAVNCTWPSGIGVCPVAGNREAKGKQAALNAFKRMFLMPYTTTPFTGMKNLVFDATAADGRSYAFNSKNALFLCLDNYPNASKDAHLVNQAFLDVRLAAPNATWTSLHDAQK